MPWRSTKNGHFYTPSPEGAKESKDFIQDRRKYSRVLRDGQGHPMKNASEVDWDAWSGEIERAGGLDRWKQWVSSISQVSPNQRQPNSDGEF